LINNHHIKCFDEDNLCVSPGWLDMQANFCDPGYEHKEDLTSGAKCAAAGGFTSVVVVATTQPLIQSKAEVLYIKNKTLNQLVDVYPMAAMSQNFEGKDLTEMYDMHLAGAIAFSDDTKCNSTAGMLSRALLYASQFNGLIVTHCEEKSLSADGKMNEGVISTQLGLKGIPALAEEITVSRNLSIAEYTNCKIHLSGISTKKSVELIKKAKSKGIKVSCSVNVFNLCFTENMLMDFDTNYKLNPPLRTKEDTDSLIRGIADGTIDVICSDHRPQDIESKMIEFDFAKSGMISLETVYSLLCTYTALSEEKLIECLSVNPRRILQLGENHVKEGLKANLTLFNPQKDFIYSLNKSFSKSKNSAFDGKSLKGSVRAVINNNLLFANS
jgi:dihydroorotase